MLPGGPTAAGRVFCCDLSGGLLVDELGGGAGPPGPAALDCTCVGAEGFAPEPPPTTLCGAVGLVERTLLLCGAGPVGLVLGTTEEAFAAAGIRRSTPSRSFEAVTGRVVTALFGFDDDMADEDVGFTSEEPPRSSASTARLRRDSGAPGATPALGSDSGAPPALPPT